MSTALVNGMSLGLSALDYVPVALGVVAIVTIGIVAYSKSGLEKEREVFQLLRDQTDCFAFVANVQADARRAFCRLDGDGNSVRRYAVICADPTGISIWVSNRHRAVRRVTIPASNVGDVLVDWDAYALVPTKTL